MKPEGLPGPEAAGEQDAPQRVVPVRLGGFEEALGLGPCHRLDGALLHLRQVHELGDVAGYRAVLRRVREALAQYRVE